MGVRNLTYSRFLTQVGKHSKAQLEQYAPSILRRFEIPGYQKNAPFQPTTFLLDYSTKKYLYVQPSCLNMFGLTVEYFLETGLDMFLSRWHKADFEVINTVVFRDNLLFLKQLQNEDYKQYIFSYNYRWLNPKKEFINVLQRFSYVPGEKNDRPAGMVGAAFDISHYKNDSTVIHSIEKVAQNEHGRYNELVFRKVHPVYDNRYVKCFSKKEIEVLRLLAVGKGSKQVASEMGISINTVNNHRRNMLKKSGCKTSSELINEAVKIGLVHQ